MASADCHVYGFFTANPYGGLAFNAISKREFDLWMMLGHAVSGPMLATYKWN